MDKSNFKYYSTWAYTCFLVTALAYFAFGAGIGLVLLILVAFGISGWLTHLVISGEKDRLRKRITVEAQKSRILSTFSTDFVAVLEPDGRFGFLNVRFRELFHDIDTAIGFEMPDRFLRHPNVNVSRSTENHKSINGLDVVQRFVRLSVKTRLGRQLFFEYNQVQVFDSEKMESLGGMVIMMDITQERRQEIMRDQLINVVIHELRNPLTGIKGLVSLLKDDDLDDRSRREYIGMLDESSNQLMNIINRFLQISRIESDDYKIEPDPVDLAEIANQAIVVLAEDLKNKKLRTRLDIEPKFPVIHGSSELLLDVFTNLLSNAIKYGPPAREIEIILKTTESQEVAVEITDYGFGIPEAYMEEIFRKFYRIREYKDQRGTGLGLSYVKEIVEKHNGRITVESNPEIGTRFRVFLPNYPDQDKARQAVADGGLPGSLKGNVKGE